MQIRDLELFAIDVPRSLDGATVASLLIRIETDSGLAGWGEARSPWQAEQLPARLEAIRHVLIGRGVFMMEELARRDLPGETGLPGGAAVRCAVDMALWDIIGRAADQPICHLLGGLYRDRVPVAVRLPLAEGIATTSLVRELADQGLHSQVLVASGDVISDFAAYAALANTAGERTQFAIDAGCRYTPTEARQLCARLEETGIACLLDPLIGQTHESLATLSRQTSVALGASATIQSPADVLDVVRHQAAGQVTLTLDQLGGISQAQKCAAITAAANVPTAVRATASGIGTAAMLHLAAALPIISAANETTYQATPDQWLTEPLVTVDGMMNVPRGPGLGIEVDRDRLEARRIA
jgi:muconate cycloisomerase